MSRLKFKTGAGHRRGRARQTRPCVLGARHAAVSKGVGERRSPKDSREGSLPDPRSAAQRGSAKGAPHEARDHAARVIRAVAAPEAEAPGHHCTLLCNCRDELPNAARELAGEANAEAGCWWKRAQEGEHKTRRATTLVRPAAVLSAHLLGLGLVIGRDLHSADVGRAAADDGSSVVLLTVPNRLRTLTTRLRIVGPRHR